MNLKRVYLTAATFGMAVTFGVLASMGGTHDYAAVHDDVLRTKAVPAANPQEPAAAKDMPGWWYDPAGIRCAGPQCD